MQNIDNLMNSGLAWMARAKQYDLEHLEVSPSKPMHVSLVEYPALRPQECDIHRALEIGIVLKGRMERAFRDYSMSCGAGDPWLCASWEPHGWQSGSSGATLLVVTMLPELLTQAPFEDFFCLELFASPPKERHQFSNPDVKRQVNAIAKELRYEVEKKPKHWETYTRLLVFRVLVILTRAWEAKTTVRKRITVYSNDLSRILPALALFQPEKIRPIKLAEASAACGLSIQRFNTIFRNVMGVSFAKYYLRVRLSYAANQLLVTDNPVAIIATESGFLDASHLHRAFVKNFNCTPAKYRHQNRTAMTGKPTGIQP